VNLPGTDQLPRLSSICISGLRRYLVTGLLRQILVDRFADPASLDEPALDGLRWSPDQTGTILIESLSAYRPEQAGKRPAILIKPNAWTVRQIGINNQKTGYTTADGVEHFETELTGSHTTFVLVQGSCEAAEILASVVFMEYLSFSSLIRERFGFARFGVAELGAPAQLVEADDTYVIPVSVAYSLLMTWQVSETGPIFKGVNFLPTPGQ
jgi:hypothetical protein